MKSFLLTACCILDLSARAADLFDETKATTLFAFDSVSIPNTQNLRLEMNQPTRHPANPVLARGAAGTPDAHGVQFYGSIILDGSKYRMWYVAFDDDVKSKVASSRWRAAYAESVDGVIWTKPNLGLVKFAGNTNNNLVFVGEKPWGFVNLKVIKDDADPDPQRRYKMTTHVYFRHQTRLGTLLPFISADGFTWKPVKPVTPIKAELQKQDLFIPGVHFEPCGGLFQWAGQYVINGQNAMPSTHHYQGRIVRQYRSADFVNWSQTSSLTFVRTPQHDYLGAGKSREGEQNHEGISVWNRGHVLLGICGRWHGAAEWKDVRVDLGFVMSNDGQNFREPQHEWTFLQNAGDGNWDQGGLIQGQGFENIGEQTFVYYGAWDPRASGGPEVARGGVGIAVLARDRFGALKVDEIGQGPGDYQLPEITAEFVSVAFLAGKSAYFINAKGLGPESVLRVEILDHLERPVLGFAGRDAVAVTESGFQTPMEWEAMNKLPERIRLRVTFEGKRRTDIRFSAIYQLPR